MEVVGLKLAGSFLDVIAKVDESFDMLNTFDFKTVTLKAPFVIQLQQVGENGGMAPNLVPLNMFSRDLKEEEITLKGSAVLFFFEIDEELENFYRQSIGDVTVQKQKVYMPK